VQPGARTAGPRGHHFVMRLAVALYEHPAAFVAVTSNVYPEFLSRPFTKIVPVVSDVLTVAPFPPSFAAYAANDVHGDSLFGAVNVTSALFAPMRFAEAVTFNGMQPHLAYRVVLPPPSGTNEAPSLYITLPVGVVAQPTKE
jgi:hypothetical protein